MVLPEVAYWRVAPDGSPEQGPHRLCVGPMRVGGAAGSRDLEEGDLLMSLRLLHPLKREESQASRVPAAVAGAFWLKPAVSGREDTPVGADGPGLPCARCAGLRLPRGSSV